MSDVGYRVVEIKRCCNPCFGARCTGCGAWLTKHDYTPEDAAACAASVLDGRTGFPHFCPNVQPRQLVLA
jgi:hypothetical protein